MKRNLALALIMTLTLSMAACGQNTDSGNSGSSAASESSSSTIDDTVTESEDPEEVLVGGWTTIQEDSLPQEAEEALNKSLEGLTGAAYEPVRLLAEQVVAGTNYAILCRVTPVVPDAEYSWCIAYVYEDLEGNAELMRVQELVPEADEDTTGGWTAATDAETVAEADAALGKALEGLEGASYESVAALGTQVVAGINYLMLCKVTAIVPDAEGSYCLVTVYEDPDGNAEITDVADLEYSLSETE